MKKVVLSLVAILLVVGGAAASTRSADAAGGDPVISGTGHLGDALTISSYGALGGGPSDFTYTWLWEGEELPGPEDYDATHVVTEADLDHELSVLVKPKQGDADRLASNRIMATGSVLRAPDVVLAGTPKVGRTLTATVSGGTPGATTAVQWLRDGAVISGATASTYRVVTGDGGRTISVRATSTGVGKDPVSRDAAAAPVPAFNSSRPTLKGAAKVGKKLKVRSRGTWYASGHRYDYQWMRNGKKIARATKSSYTLTSKDRGKRITLVVRAKRTGFPTVAASSARSHRVT